ncbi:hypothetical protein ALC53_11591 [Atta colombica]|uniref:Uncharacterized protein n=1 Tax=Atta colombica TaxID=520822 RepID=A0A195B098_9HYME|nr:hypothetical protein ALC53_11591 [Atta colombica]
MKNTYVINECPIKLITKQCILVGRLKHLPKGTSLRFFALLVVSSSSSLLNTSLTSMRPFFRV